MAAEPIPAPIARACRQVRPATPADAVAGVQPSLVAVPASTQECADLLRAATALRLAVIPRGTGSRMHWGYPPQRADLVLDTAGLDQVVEHAAGDLVATVQAGVSLERLAEALGAAGQRLALDPHSHPTAGSVGADPPAATRGTVGGVLASGAAGPLRLRYGTGRDLLIGITVVRADGTVAKSGGKVVKNVAGYDLGKLFAGSRGTLGLITQATFRLHPVPAETAFVSARCAAAVDACQVLASALESPAAPVAAEIDWPTAGDQVRVCLALEGDAAGVAERAIALADLVGRLGRETEASVSPQAPPWWGGGAAAQQDGTVLQLGFWPGDLGMVLAEIRAAAAAAGLDPAIGGSAGAGLLHVGLPAERDPGAVAAFVAVLRGALGHGLPADAGHRLTDVPRPLARSHAASTRPWPSSGGGPATTGNGGVGPGGRTPGTPGGASPGGRPPGTPGEPAGPGQPRSGEGPPARAHVLVLHAPPAVGALVDMFGPIPSLPLMRAVKDQFDPDRIMSPGRFAGRI